MGTGRSVTQGALAGEHPGGLPARGTPPVAVELGHPGWAACWKHPCAHKPAVLVLLGRCSPTQPSSPSWCSPVPPVALGSLPQLLGEAGTGCIERCPCGSLSPSENISFGASSWPGARQITEESSPRAQNRNRAGAGTRARTGAAAPCPRRGDRGGPGGSGGEFRDIRGGPGREDGGWGPVPGLPLCSRR